ncbi:hypothetical protein HTY52_12885 [Cupriavidus taiwanensis]|uniref:hypothetical protein n=1 Tax=Cupriavidus taiwanensis TaxID=164546 RepID=UPI001574EAEA|nr:hypothetical protein [Cupriavidus taiwanensis]NSX14971.1 hypothetical protein [Cupriavidus taiwanensis]
MNHVKGTLMNKNSTGVQARQGRNRTQTARIFPFPHHRREGQPGECDHISITLQADGTHNVRMVGRYAEAPEIAVEALDLVMARIAPPAVSRCAGKILNFPARRFA